jgi:predicted porin
MDTMIIDEIAQDRDADVWVGGISYTMGDLSMLYAYGDFLGDKDSVGKKAHITEQDIGFAYNVNDEFIMSGIYVIEEDKENSSKTDYDWNRMQVMVTYNF